MCKDGRGLGTKLVSFTKGFSKHPHILAIFKVDSEYLRFPFKAKVDYFILHSILLYSFVIFLIFFCYEQKKMHVRSRTVLSLECFKRKQKWTTAYQHVISRASDISVSIKGTFWYLSLFFLEWTVRKKKIPEVSLLSSTVQLLQSDLLIKYILDYKSRPPKFRAESK